MNAKFRDAKKSLRIYLAEREMSLAALCDKLGLPHAHVYSAVNGKGVGFKTMRYLLRIEREIGKAIWTDAEEFAQLQSIGAKLDVDIYSVPLKDIRAAAHRKGLTDVWIFDGAPYGFPIFRELIRHFFPATQTINGEHYTSHEHHLLRHP